MNPEQAAVRQSAKEFVAGNIIPYAEYYDKSGDFHAYLLEATRTTGIFAMAVPTEYGGLGDCPLTQALVLEEWGYGCAAMGTTLSASILSMEAVLIGGNEDQKRRFCKPMLEAGLGAFALTEPAAGSDASAGVATAVKSGNDYILNSPKCWITNGGVASVYVVFAATDPAIIEQIPCQARIRCRDPLKSAAGVDKHMIANGHILVGEESQVNITTRTSGLTTGNCPMTLTIRIGTVRHIDPPPLQSGGLLGPNCPDSPGSVSTHARSDRPCRV